MMRFFYIILTIALMPLLANAELGSLNSKAPISINADSLEVLQKDAVAVFRGNVVASQADTQISANSMTVYYGGKTSEAAKNATNAAPKINKIEVEGNVFIKTKTETAQGSKGVYDVANGTITLTGGVTLTRDKNIIKGSALSIDMNKGYSKIINDGAGGGRVQGLFTAE